MFTTDDLIEVEIHIKMLIPPKDRERLPKAIEHITSYAKDEFAHMYSPRQSLVVVRIEELESQVIP